MENNSQEIKKIYKDYSDQIMSKRYNSEFPLRKYAHRTQYDSILRFINPGDKVLDLGCGEGTLSILMAQKGAIVTGVDISDDNIKNANKYAQEKGLNIEFKLGDAEKTDLPGKSFDVVVSSHVLEHLPDFHKGVLEIERLSRRQAIIALPTCLNCCSLIQIGHGAFWQKNIKSFLAYPFGLLKTIIAFLTFQEGPNEGYAGHDDIPHIWRFPWVMRKKIQASKMKITHFEAATLVMPYFNFLLPIIKKLDQLKAKPIIKNFGYGSFAVLSVEPESNLKEELKSE